MALDETSRTKRWVWIVSGALGVIFLAAGLTKVFATPMQTSMFEQFGFPMWLVPIIGVLELVFGLFLFIPRLRSYGAMGVGAVMVGAILTHVMTGVLLPMLLLNVLLFTGAVWVALKQRPKFLSVGRPGEGHPRGA